MADSQGIVEQIPVVDGSMYGIGSFVAGYLATLVLVVVAEGNQLSNDFVEGAGWVYYNAQFASVDVRPPRGTGTETAVESSSINYLTGQGPEGMAVAATELPAVVYHVIPVVVLVAGGYALASQLGATNALEGVIAGGSLAFGTVIFALAGTFVFQLGRVGPNRLQGVLLVGILFPVAFGSLGGVLRTRLSSRLRAADP